MDTAVFLMGQLSYIHMKLLQCQQENTIELV